jgi:hypothetical protein
VERIQEKTDHATSNADAFFQKVNAFQAELRARKRNLGIILGVVAVNICFLWLKRRSLHRA